MVNFILIFGLFFEVVDLPIGYFKSLFLSHTGSPKHHHSRLSTKGLVLTPTLLKGPSKFSLSLLIPPNNFISTLCSIQPRLDQ
jgi:hypothetical protein